MKEDIKRIQEILKSQGIEKDFKECRDAWDNYSKGSNVSWHHVNYLDDRTIYNIVSKYLNIEKEFIPQKPKVKGYFIALIILIVLAMIALIL